MTRHGLPRPSVLETMWFQRRDTLKAASAWLLMGGLPAALAQQRSNLVELVGDAVVNGKRLLPGQTLQTGDEIQTGPASTLIFVIGDSSFQVRQNSHFSLERGNTLTTVSQLRLHAGAVASVWGANSRHQIITPNLNAGFRSAGVYTEVFETREQHSYLCNCYGTLTLSAGKEKTVSTSTYHEAFWALAESSESEVLMPADSIRHADEELEFLARLISQKTAWQVSGQKSMSERSE